MPLRSLVALLVSLSLTGCAGDDPLVVLAASSLSDVAEDLVAAGARDDALVSEAGSQVIAAQVRAGAPADLVLLADPDLADALAEEGLLSPPRPIATAPLAIVSTPEAAVTTPDDLLRPGLRLVLADAGVPLGDYTRTALERLEDAGRLPEGATEEVLGAAVSLEDAARAVLAKVRSGDADAAVVYAPDARAAGADVVATAWPDPRIRAVYTLQTPPSAADGGQLAGFLRSPAAAPIWRRHGFTPASDG